MKKILFSLIFITISLPLFAIGEVSTDINDIPHYKIYPRTPAVEYKEDILDFYSVKNAYGEFSNFGLFPVFIDGKIWPSSEHYYQAQKFFDEALKEQIRNAKTPFEAAQTARDPKMPLREDWDQVKDGVMEKVVREKFKTYPTLTELLLSTKESAIYEHTKNDCYWADCLDRTGQNKLGHTLELIRLELLYAQKTENSAH